MSISQWTGHTWTVTSREVLRQKRGQESKETSGKKKVNRRWPRLVVDWNEWKGKQVKGRDKERAERGEARRKQKEQPVWLERKKRKKGRDGERIKVSEREGGDKYRRRLAVLRRSLILHVIFSCDASCFALRSAIGLPRLIHWADAIGGWHMATAIEGTNQMFREPLNICLSLPLLFSSLPLLSDRTLTHSITT